MRKQEMIKLLQEYPKQHRMIETQKKCVDLLNRQIKNFEPRTTFIVFLSDVLRHIGVRLWGMQAVILFLTCISICNSDKAVLFIQLYMPLFILACLPSFFQGQTYGMSEIESVTRASNAQIMLAKMTLAGAADLISLTVILTIVVLTSSTGQTFFQLILYSLIPMLACLVVALWCIRTCKNHSMQIVIASCVAISAFFGCTFHWMPFLYDLSALGVWMIAFLFFSVFFAREIYILVHSMKEGKMYGAIS